MPRLETALYDYLTGDPGLAVLVGDRVYPIPGPEGTVIPYISWVRVSASRLYTFDAFEDTDAWTQARVQFNCWSYSAVEAMEVGDALLAALSGFDGAMGAELIGSSFAINELDTYEPETKIHRRVLDFQISYEDDVLASS